MEDPEYARQYKKAQDAFKIKFAERLNMNTTSRQMMDPIIIPVAVHFPSGLESDRACLEALAQNQIDILNEDFTGTNADISGWTDAASFYPGVNTGAANILFCIATMNHPTGLDPEMVEGGPAVSIGYNFGNGNPTDAAWGGYMNFLVKSLDEGTLGFSPLGGSIANGDSVTMNLGAFGSGAGCPNSGIVPAAPFNLGRTVTHELGHFYNLNHTFTGSCTNDDNIADTPNQNQPSGGCPTLGANPACDASEQVLYQSFMDYTDDACMIMFSAGQIAVAEAYIMSIQSTFKPNVVSCSPSPNFSITVSNSTESICNTTNDAVYNISYSATGGNTTTTTFSASNLPAGATASFSPSSLNDTGNVTMTVSNLSGLTAGNYTITITGTGIETKTVDVDLQISAVIPAIPNLTLPANGQTDTPLIINLEWSNIIEANAYVIEMATDNTFTTNATSNTATNNSFTTPLLDSNTQYFWRVKSTNSCGDSSYSSANSFTTASVTCNTFTSTENNIAIAASGNDPHIATSTINVTTEIVLSDINVTANLQHDWAGDIELKLTSPAGTEVILLPNSLCDDGTDNIAVTYDDQASGPVVCNTTAPAVGGIVKPASPLSAFNGESTLGNWILTVTDGYPSADGGQFLNFSMDICGTAALSTDEFSFEKSLSVWPNPTNQTNVFNKKLKFGNLDSSIYILSIENNSQIINKRIVIN